MITPVALGSSIQPVAWTSRQWSLGLPASLLPQVLERLRGTPARAEELVRGFRPEMLSRRPLGGWSAQEHIGHLHDLHALDETRLAEFLGGKKVLTAADPGNALTARANHNATPVQDLLQRLRHDRLALVRRLAQLSVDEAARSAVHPRLKQPMSVVDWMFFVAEHDDHHLAQARYVASLATRDDAGA